MQKYKNIVENRCFFCMVNRYWK